MARSTNGSAQTTRHGEFETLAWVYSQGELAVLLCLLEHEDIFVLPITRHHISADWRLTVALGGVEIRVRPEDAERAWALFAGVDRTPFSRGIFSDNRWLDGAIMVILALAGLFAAPARIPAHFVEPRSVAGRPAQARPRRRT
jgi:hypothetical protein